MNTSEISTCLYQKGSGSVAICDAAFIVTTPASRTPIAGKGPWQLEVQVAPAQTPGSDAEQRLAKTICSRMT